MAHRLHPPGALEAVPGVEALRAVVLLGDPELDPGQPWSFAHRNAARTRRSPTPRPRPSGCTHIDTSSARPASTGTMPISPYVRSPSCATNWLGRARRSRHLSSVNACSNSHVEPNASGASASAARRTVRYRAQSSAASGRTESVVMRETLTPTAIVRKGYGWRRAADWSRHPSSD